MGGWPTGMGRGGGANWHETNWHGGWWGGGGANWHVGRTGMVGWGGGRTGTEGIGMWGELALGRLRGGGGGGLAWGANWHGRNWHVGRTGGGGELAWKELVCGANRHGRNWHVGPKLERVKQDAWKEARFGHLGP